MFSHYVPLGESIPVSTWWICETGERALLCFLVTPPPPVSKNHLAQEPTPGSTVKFSHHFFYQGSGFFMFLVDVGQLFGYAGHHFMCVTTGPPTGGTLSVTHRRTYPLNPSPLLSTPSPKQPAPDKKQTNVN